MAMYEYKVWHYKGDESYTFRTVDEVCRFTGLTHQKVRTSIAKHRTVEMYRIERYDVKELRKGITDHTKAERRKRVRKYSERDGIIGFDDEGASHEYRSVDEASRETRIPKLHIRECLLEGCAYLGWTFDYGYADCAEDKG